MNLTESYAFHYVLKPDSTHTSQLDPKKAHQKLAAGHKLVLAFASLSSISHHTGEPTPVASAYAYFTEYTQDGQIKTADGPIVTGKNITDIHWNLKADKCWVRGSIVILAFD